MALARRIGLDLCREAYWNGARCNWIGHLPAEAADPVAPRSPVLASLGPDLYAGTAGVALFLARLFEMSGARAFRATAAGAIRHALDHSHDLPPSAALGLYGGGLGVALAAARVAQDLGSDALLREAVSVAQAASAAPAEHPLDLAGGSAGAVLALLSMRQLAPDAPFLERAIDLGDEIAKAAVRQGGGWAWETRRASGADLGSRPLTGLAHGAAGMGLALLELHRATGRADFAQGAELAFAYEDQLFDASASNWPDLREHSSSPGRGDAGLHFAMGWCHGAPGIGLSRLRAIQLVGPRPRLRRGCRAAIRAVRRRLTELEDAGPADLTPCHGVAGLVELLLVASRALADPGLRTEARRAWQRALARRDRGAWVYGTAAGGWAPGLLIGIAGIGYSLLRAHAPSRVPSVLLVH